MKNSNKNIINKSHSDLRKTLTKSSIKSKLSKSQLSLKQDSFKHSDSILRSREVLSNKLQTYSLLIRCKNPIRCLDHNSNFSIYCETQQKLLCANCIFGKNDHKFHKIISIQRCYNSIQRDIEIMNRLIDKEMEAMKKTSQKLIENLMLEQKDSQNILLGLVNMYQDCHRKLQESFIQSRNKILDRIEGIRSSHQKKVYNIQLLLSTYSSYNFSKSINEEHITKQDYLVYDHAVCTAITAQKRFEQKDWIIPKGQMAKLVSEQIKKIKLISLQINKALLKPK